MTYLLISGILKRSETSKGKEIIERTRRIIKKTSIEPGKAKYKREQEFMLSKKIEI